MTAHPIELSPAELAALERLTAHAQGDTQQSRRVADFLLAWINAAECGVFDVTTVWGVEDQIFDDMVAVFRLGTRLRPS
ncbi:hypothetical protein [Burkholderia territorii]|uniref:DUF7673 family protein n=1 Tax=Burkholderia territorii TaxID=1503055 RepID=UPI000A8F4B08